MEQLTERPITILEALEYEVSSSFAAGARGMILWPIWAREIMGAYFAWKVRIKHARYMEIRRLRGEIA